MTTFAQSARIALKVTTTTETLTLHDVLYRRVYLHGAGGGRVQPIDGENLGHFAWVRDEDLDETDASRQEGRGNTDGAT